jgi:hypothetical protein
MLLYDKIDIVICCNEQSSDWDVHEFIIASNGRIIEMLLAGMREKQRMNAPIS